MTRSLSIWQPTFPKGLGATAGRPRVAPSTPIIFDVQLLYIPGVSNFDEQKADDPKDLPIDRGISSPLKQCIQNITFFLTMMLYKSWGFSLEVLSTIFQERIEKIHQKYRRSPP
jgi:hypothetical protein